MKNSIKINDVFPSRFTLIELLVVIAQYYRQLKTVFAPAKTLPLFLKRDGGLGEEIYRSRRSAFSREKKFFASPSSARFTLIELLVVIAIIAILASMLMPALQKARDTAKTSQCISNIGTVSKTTMFYQDSFGDFFPWGAYDGSVTYYWNRFSASSTAENRFKAPLRDFWPTDTPDARFACYERANDKRVRSRYVCPATTDSNMSLELPDPIAPNLPQIGRAHV